MKYILKHRKGRPFFVTCSEHAHEEEHQLVYDHPSELGKYLRDVMILENIKHLSIVFRDMTRQGLEHILSQFSAINGKRAASRINTEHYTLDIFYK